MSPTSYLPPQHHHAAVSPFMPSQQNAAASPTTMSSVHSSEHTLNNEQSYIQHPFHVSSFTHQNMHPHVTSRIPENHPEDEYSLSATTIQSVSHFSFGNPHEPVNPEASASHYSVHATSIGHVPVSIHSVHATPVGHVPVSVHPSLQGHVSVHPSLTDQVSVHPTSPPAIHHFHPVLEEKKEKFTLCKFDPDKMV